MARYCFYCGRALAEGERCSCRTARSSNFRPEFHDKTKADAERSVKSETTARTAGADQKAQEEPQDRKRKRSFRERFAARRARRVNERQARKTRRKEERGRKREKNFSTRGALSFLHNLFTRPTEVIASARHASRLHIIITYLLEALVFSLLILTFVRFSNLTRITLLRQLQLNNDLLWESAGMAMLRGFLAALILAALRVLISRLVFRFVGRQRILMQDLCRAFLPGTYYGILLMLISLIFVSGTGLQSLVMLLCAYALRVMIDTWSLKDTVQLSTDRLLVQSAVIHFLLFISLAFLLNFVVPSLSRMNPEPQNPNEFSPNLEYSEVYKL